MTGFWLVRMIEERAPKPGASRARRVELRIGEQSGVEIDLLETAWKQARIGTLCADSELTIDRVEALLAELTNARRSWLHLFCAQRAPLSCAVQRHLSWLSWLSWL